MGTPKGRITVCRVEYETKDKTNWKATILAYNMQDAINYLMKNVPAFDRYTSTQIIGPVDAIDNQIVKDFFTKETKIVETIVQAPSKYDEYNKEDSLPTCPWCDKEFKTKVTLGTHIKKYHMD